MMAGGWEHSAEAYVHSFGRLCAGTVPAILDRLGSGQNRLLLDIGTGPGTVAAAAKLNGDRVLGMDRDDSMTALAARQHPHIKFVRGALPRLPCTDGSFDAITANFVVNHTPDPRASVRELFRALRVGGVLVATIWTSRMTALNQLWHDVIQAAEIVPASGTRLAPELDFERTIDGFAAIVGEAGFAEVDCQETQWTFAISPDDLWVAVEAGIAGIGQTYTAQAPDGRRRMRTAYHDLTKAWTTNGDLRLPSVALVAAARRVSADGR